MFTQASAAATNEKLGRKQLAAAQQFCASGQHKHPNPAKFAGAQLSLDCALKDGTWLSLRGYLREHQAAEVINPANEFVAGLSMLDFRVSDAADTTAPMLLNVAAASTSRPTGVVIAIGYGAAGRWTASSGLFKLLSIVRILRQPLQPGPVFALVLSRASTASTELNAMPPATLLAAQFEQIAQAITAAAQDSEDELNKARIRDPVPTLP
jgi:hypothetical protein